MKQIGVTAVVLAGSLAFSGPSGAQTSNPNPTTLQVQTLDGQAVSLPGLVEGKPTLLIFWATWCRSCRQQMPHFQEAFRRFASKGLNVIAINIGIKDTPATVKQYAADTGLSFPIFFDANHTATKAYNVAATPGVLLLDRSGAVVSSANAVDFDAIDALLAGKPIPAAKRQAMPRGSGSI